MEIQLVYKAETRPSRMDMLDNVKYDRYNALILTTEKSNIKKIKNKKSGLST